LALKQKEKIELMVTEFAGHKASEGGSIHIELPTLPKSQKRDWFRSERVELIPVDFLLNGINRICAMPSCMVTAYRLSFNFNAVNSKTFSLQCTKHKLQKMISIHHIKFVSMKKSKCIRFLH
jgi:hypothetical protein